MLLQLVRHPKMHFSKKSGKIYSLFAPITENGVAVRSFPAEALCLIK